jgi:hypothetical protein
MKAQSNFLIKHYQYFDEKGKCLNEYYYIQEFKKFLWWSYWSDITHQECEWDASLWDDSNRIRTTFKTIEEARDFVRNVLCPEIPRKNSRETIVEEMVCKNGNSEW